MADRQALGGCGGARHAVAMRHRPVGKPFGRHREHVVPEPEIPSHQGPDAQSVDPDLDVITMAVKVPQTLAHLHYWAVRMPRKASKDEVLEAFSASSRIALIRMADGLGALNPVKEMMADLGRPNDSLYEVALWEDMLKVEGDELF